MKQYFTNFTSQTYLKESFIVLQIIKLFTPSANCVYIELISKAYRQLLNNLRESLKDDGLMEILLWKSISLPLSLFAVI